MSHWVRLLSAASNQALWSTDHEKADRSVEETEDFSTDMLGTGLVMVHDALVGGEDEHAELTGGEDGVGEVLELSQRQIEARRDDTALVEATVEVDDDLAGAGVIDDLELVDVAVLLHDLEELDQHLGGGPQDNLYKKSWLENER